MMWEEYNNITQAMRDIPNGSIKYADHAIPDLYGKALHLYFALNSSNEKNYEKEINMWRGLLTLFALQDHLKLPLSWEQVSLPEQEPGMGNNLLDAALQHPPEATKRILSTDLGKKWSGDYFYVLKWTNGVKSDLLLYSPVTLVCPVANWPMTFARLKKVKWFDRVNQCFIRPETVLNDHEKRIVCFWLKSMSNQFNLPNANEAQSTIKRHLDLYIKDLGVTLSEEEETDQFDFVDIHDENINRDGLFKKLRMSVKATLPRGKQSDGNSFIKVNHFFADQICYFQTEGSNPFADCRHSDHYKIQSKDGWYAFLPVRPCYREYFRKNDLAKNIHMEWMTSKGIDIIHVELVMSGNKYEKNYRITQTATVDPDTAVPFMRGMTDEKTMPVVSVWPGRIGEAWKKYYIMLDGTKCESGDLRVADLPQTVKSSNGYVVQTAYVPDAIPVVKRLRNNDGEVSIGMITPKLDPPRKKPAYISADVAVDFGTSSTRVFVKIDQEIEEINIAEDAPLLVTSCDLIRANIMRDYFVPPDFFKRGSDTLFSIYRRSGDLRSTVQPVLDGAIYQQGAISIVEFIENIDYLMPDLKWTARTNRAYYTAFMQQLFLHVASWLYEKGVTSIKWRYALPEKMDPDILDVVRDIWKNALLPYLDGFVGTIKSKIECELTESEAASRYFLFTRENPIHAKKGYLVVDIGGGSTDIALWQGEPQNIHMKWHSSVNVAGRKMFTCWIEKHIEQLCESTQDYNITAHLDMIKEAPSAMRRVLIEMLLNANYDVLLENYRQECIDHKDGWGMELRKEINMSISLLMFALGYQIGALISSGEFNVPDGLGAFTVAFGGRGAKMLEWRGYEFKFLIDIFKAGVSEAGVQKNFAVEIEVSQNPKCEVARGLLVDQPLEATVSNSVDVQISTEKYLDAAEAFQKAFNTVFRNVKTKEGRRFWPFDSKRINRNSLAAQIEKEDNQEIVNVFMETIFNFFNKPAK